jgi:uncharacterized membrane protein
MYFYIKLVINTKRKLMGVYVTSKCPNCDYHIKHFEIKTNHSKFGTPIIKCQNCSQLIKTKKKLWRDMTMVEKFIHYFFEYFLTVLGSSVMFTVIIDLIVMYSFDLENYMSKDILNEKLMSFSLKIFIVLLIVFFYRVNKVDKEERRIIEKDFDEQQYDYQEF